MVNPYLVKLTFYLFSLKHNKYQEPNEKHDVRCIESYAYDKVLVIKYFRTTTNFSRTYVCNARTVTYRTLYATKFIFMISITPCR